MARMAAGLLASAAVPASLGAASVFDVRDYGAAGDGLRKDTAAINRAVGACAAAGGGEVRVPPGRYLTGTVILRSHVTFTLETGATLVGSEDPADYLAAPSGWGDRATVLTGLLYAEDAVDVALTGRGTIDGQGAIWWRRLELAHPRKDRAGARTAEERAEAAKLARGRPHLIRLVRCRDVLVEGLTLRNSPEWNIHPLFCENVRIEGVSIYAPPSDIGPGASHNTDGINPESCRDVFIAGCLIDNGDDCITLKSGADQWGRRMGRPTEDVVITHCIMLHGHGGVTIGSEMSGGVRNVAVSNCVFHGTETGIRIKSERGRGGVVEGIAVSDIVMQDVPVPFVITAFYDGRADADEVRPVGEGTPRFRDLHFVNITARGARAAGMIAGLREMPIEGVAFDQVTIQAESGFACANARDLSFTATTIDTAKGPALVLRRCAEVASAGLRTRAPHAGIPLVVDDSRP